MDNARELATIRTRRSVAIFDIEWLIDHPGGTVCSQSGEDERDVTGREDLLRPCTCAIGVGRESTVIY